MSEDEDMIQQLEQAKKSKASLIEVLNQFDIIKEAFTQASRLEERQLQCESQLKAVQSQMLDCLSIGIFKQQSEDLFLHIEKTIRLKFEEFTQKTIDDLQQRPSISEMEESMRQRVNWQHFNGLAQQVTQLKTRVEKHIVAEFEGFKTKMKIELSHKANEAEDLHADLLNNEEIISLKNRIDHLEQQVKMMHSGGDEMLAEDEKDEEYDSEEELDNMNEDDLVRALMKNKKNEESETKKEPEIQGTESETQKESVKENEEEPNEQSTIKNEETEAEAKVKTNNQEEYPKEEEKNEESSRNKKKEEENPETGSRAGQSRAGSRTSSMGGVGAVGGNTATSLNKKITQIKKEMEDFRKEIEECHNLIKNSDKEIEETNQAIADVRNEIKALGESQNKMQTSFINALNRKGIGKKQDTKKEPVNAGLSKQDLEKIQNKIDEKTKRIVNLESNIDKVIQDTNQLKSLQRDKMNEIIQSLRYLDEAKQYLLKNFDIVRGSLVKLEKKLDSGIDTVREDMKSLQEPMANILSDQQRENEALSEDIRRHQGLFRNLVENYASTLDIRSPDDTSQWRTKSIQRVLSMQNEGGLKSPQPTLRHKLSNRHSYRRNLSVQSEMLNPMDTHGQLYLPRINKNSHVASSTLELNLPFKNKLLRF